MTRRAGRIRELVVVSGLFLGAVAAAWAQQGPETIGEITAIRKTVSVVHGGASAALPLATRQPLLVADTLQTGERAGAQALFRDDTMLTLGPQTRLEISEYLHDPGQHIRRMTVKLAHGTVRVLVGRAFPGLGSMFVVQAGTASIIAGTAYCTVWSHEGEIGAANIGTSGAVSFAAAGRVVMLEPGFYTIAQTGKPPGAAQPMNATVPPVVRQAIGETEMGDDLGSAVNELAEQEIEEELRACPPGSPPGGICPRKPPPAALSPATPPAVTSGAKRR